MTRVTFGSVELDSRLPELVRHVDQRVITRNAAASLDYNPIHVNPVWAKEVNLLGEGTTIAHGMCTFSFMTSVVTDWCSPSGGFVSRLESKFIRPVRPGDTITCKGMITEKHPRQKEKSFVVIELSAENQRHEKVAVAKARVILPE
jgi:3-hydroxybutyryl-CoA dehydratase